jgi:hypothetical protein
MEAYKKDIFERFFMELDADLLIQHDYEEFIEWVEENGKNALSAMWSEFRYSTRDKG